MNSYLLFAGGVLFGILFSLSIILRNSPSVDKNTIVSTGAVPSNGHPGHHLPEQLESNDKQGKDFDFETPGKLISSSTVPIKSTVSMFETDSLPNSVAFQNKQLEERQQLKERKRLIKMQRQQQQQQQEQQQTNSPVTSTTTVTTPGSSIGESVSQSDSSASKPRWSPGKQGTLDRFKSAADSIQAEFINSPKAATNTGVEGSLVPGLTKKQQMKAAKLLKRKQMQQSALEAEAAFAKASASVTSASATVGLSSASSSNGSKTTSILPPAPFYHEQALRDHAAYSPYIPTFEEAAASAGTALPDMALQRAAYEKENLKLHLCNDVYEAYSASYLTTKEHMIKVESEGYNLSWVNCEMASFIHMKSSNKFYRSGQEEGVVMQSLDVLDFSVIHLSAFERSSNKHRHVLWSNRADMVKEWHNIDPVIEAGKRLAALNDPKVRTRPVRYLPEALRTVVLMPFLGGAMGAGHSKLNNRYEYLKTCFWSLYEFFPFIVAGVTRQEDIDWGMNESGLPFFDMLLLPNLPKSAGLPVGTTQVTKQRLLDTSPAGWGSKFDYVFFTESDQILISRELPLMYAHLKKYPGHMLLPHRLMPYSSKAISIAHQRDLKHPHSQLNTWMNQSCCLPRQNCRERKTWLSIKDPQVPVINYYGLYVPLGNVNFLDEKYRACRMSPYVGERGYCP